MPAHHLMLRALAVRNAASKHPGHLLVSSQHTPIPQARRSRFEQQIFVQADLEVREFSGHKRRGTHEELQKSAQRMHWQLSSNFPPQGRPECQPQA